MKISVLQTKQDFYYGLNQLEEFPLERCLAAHAAAMDAEFARMETILQEGTKLLVTIEGLNWVVNPLDPRYHFADIAEPLDGPLMQRFCALSRKYEAYIVAGLFTSQNGKAYNSAVLFGPEGNIVGIHNKVHLPAGEELSFAHGDRFEVFETPYGNIGMLVCWDLQFPEAARELALLGADIIAVPTWGCEMKYVPCRAYENSVTLAVAMGMPGNGDLDTRDPSCIVDNMGNVVAVGSRTQADVVTADIDIRKEPAPQYGSEAFTGWDSMRRTRLSQRRPETYRETARTVPPVMKRYD